MRAAPVVLALLLAPAVAGAHAFAPSVLALDERAPGRFDVRFTPPVEEPDQAPPAWPAGCSYVGAAEHAGTLTCPAGLAGARFVAPAGARSEILLRATFLTGAPLTTVIAPGGAVELPVPAARTGVPWRYCRLGVVHILGGVDHLLFVLGLTILVGRRRALAGVLTAFTAGHSVTLALAALGVLRLPPPPVEALIALSLVLLGRELALPVGERAPRPYLLALGFGLLHGLGFAGALAEIGLPDGQVALALAAFNVGVELGQLAFVGALLAVGAVAAPLVRRASPRAPALVVGALGVALLLDRVSSFFSVPR